MKEVSQEGWEVAGREGLAAYTNLPQTSCAVASNEVKL